MRNRRIALAFVGLLPAAVFLYTIAAPYSQPAERFKGAAIGVEPLGSRYAQAEAKRTFDLKIEHRKVVGGPNVIRVTQGEMVSLHWTTDENKTIHLHGYDIQKRVKPDTPVVFTFKAHATGRFPITAHGFGEHSDEEKHSDEKEETTLLYVEVHPR